MYNIPIFIPYETKVRELDGKLLLITYLLKSGFSNIYLGSRSSIKKQSLLHENGFYFLKSLSNDEEAFYKTLKMKGFLIVLLHAEGGIHYKDNKTSIESLFNSTLLKYIDFNFVFGEQIKTDIIKYCGAEFTDRIFVSGEPRFDLLKPKFRAFYNKRIDEIRRDYPEGYILVNTSFSVGNPVVGVQNLINSFKNESTYTEETKQLLIRKSDFMGFILTDFINAIYEISEKFPFKHIIIRPHPSESMEVYLDAFRSKDNVHISKEGNVQEWILASDCVIHYDCTTGMEAVLAGKKVISYLPRVDSKIVAWLPIELSDKAYNIDDLLSKIHDIIVDKYSFAIPENIQASWRDFVHNVEHSAAEIIVKVIDKSNFNRNVTYVQRSRNLLIFTYFVDRLRRFKRRFWRNKPDISRIKFGDLNRKEIVAKMKCLLSIISVNMNIEIRRISEDLIRFQRKS